jgi:hypothetical protein
MHMQRRCRSRGGASSRRADESTGLGGRALGRLVAWVLAVGPLLKVLGRTHDATGGAVAHQGLMFPALTTSVHLRISASIRALNSSGVLPTGRKPSSISR